MEVLRRDGANFRDLVNQHPNVLTLVPDHHSVFCRGVTWREIQYPPQIGDGNNGAPEVHDARQHGRHIRDRGNGVDLKYLPYTQEIDCEQFACEGDQADPYGLVLVAYLRLCRRR